MDTFETIRTVRSIREFAPRPVPMDVIERILDAGRLSGSSKNTQPWQFIVVQNPVSLEALSKCGDYAAHLKGANFGIAILTPADKQTAYDSGRCSQNMMLAAWNQGVGSCIASMYREDDARRILGVPADYSIRHVISFGYPANPPRPPRRGGRTPLAEIVFYDKWQARSPIENPKS